MPELFFMQPQASTNKRHQIFLSYRKNDCGRLGAGDKTAILLKSKLVEFGWTVFLDEEGIEGVN